MDIPLSDDLYQRFRDLLLARSGLLYPEHRRNDLRHGLTMVLSRTVFKTLDELYQAATVDRNVLGVIIDGLTIGETYFFRNTPQFQVLREVIIPDLVTRRESLRAIRIWSAGCATGEEPYSLAMLLNDVLPDAKHWQTTILATDINTQFLARAREGLYGEWSFRETDPKVRERYFAREGTRWRLSPEIRRQVLFSRLNLVEDHYPSVLNGTSMLDLILCRNVLIYFDDDTIRTVGRRMYQALTPGGWLIVGHAEARSDFFSQFETYNFPDTVIYRKPLTAPLFAGPTVSPQLSTPATPPPVVSALGSVTRTPMDRQVPPAAKPLPAFTLPETPDVEKNAPPPVDLLAEARAAANAGDWDTTLRLCETALQQQPMLAEAHLMIGQVLEQKGHLDNALAAYRRAAYLDHHLVLASLAMASIWERTGHTRDALRSYRGLLYTLSSLAPDTPIMHAEGATAEELKAFVNRQITALQARA